MPYALRYVTRRGVYTLQKALYLTKRALLIAKRALYVIQKSPVCLYVCFQVCHKKSPGYPPKSPVCHKKSPCISQKEPLHMTKRAMYVR